ncbi:MAG: hypothetical protein ACI83I_001416 [Bacteroidia bacterium]|jgi:hypothetical protein
MFDSPHAKCFDEHCTSSMKILKRVHNDIEFEFEYN